jgi:hypothetical protein
VGGSADAGGGQAVIGKTYTLIGHRQKQASPVARRCRRLTGRAAPCPRRENLVRRLAKLKSDGPSYCCE